jgi:hypothetical protein
MVRSTVPRKRLSSELEFDMELLSFHFISLPFLNVPEETT